MFRALKTTAAPVPAHDAARNLGEMTTRLGVDPAPPAKAAPASASSPAASPASWPTGVSLLAQMVDACQRCEATEVCDDWLARAPKAIAAVPPFCPNADALMQAKKAK
jgi:hypothetical protein